MTIAIDMLTVGWDTVDIFKKMVTALERAIRASKEPATVAASIAVSPA